MNLNILMLWINEFDDSKYGFSLGEILKGTVEMENHVFAKASSASKVYGFRKCDEDDCKDKKDESSNDVDGINQRT